MDQFDSKAYEAEARKKWGGTAAWQEYEARTARPSSAAELDTILESFAVCLRDGCTEDSPRAQALVKQLQAHISANYYTCTDVILAGLGQMYSADPRFRQNIDRHGEGTAAFITAAILRYCEK